MPAGTDLITWSPRVGATGDDRYYWPEDNKIFVGDSAGYSSTPTIAEVNLGTGLNQIIAEIKRRMPSGSTYQLPTDTTWYTSGYWTVPSALSYLQPDFRIKASDFTNIKSSVQQVRRFDGKEEDIIWFSLAPGTYLAPYSFSTSPTANTKFLREFIKDLRKALATDHIVIHPKKSLYQYGVSPFVIPYMELRVGTTDHATYLADGGTKILSQGSNGALSNVRRTFVNTVTDRRRFFCNYEIPDISIAQLYFSFRYYHFASVNFNMRLYEASTDIGQLDIGDWASLGTLVYEELVDNLVNYERQELLLPSTPNNENYFIIGSNEYDATNILPPTGDEYEYGIAFPLTFLNTTRPRDLAILRAYIN